MAFPCTFHQSRVCYLSRCKKITITICLIFLPRASSRPQLCPSGTSRATAMRLSSMLLDRSMRTRTPTGRSLLALGKNLCATCNTYFFTAPTQARKQFFKNFPVADGKRVCHQDFLFYQIGQEVQQNFRQLQRKNFQTITVTWQKKR